VRFKTIKLLSGAGLLVVSTAFAAPAAQAAPTAHSTGSQHCVQQVVEPGARVPAPRCFASYAQVISYLTGGRVRLVGTSAATTDGSGTTRLDAQIRDGEIANTTYVLSTEYTNSGYGGSTYTFTWSSSCASVNIAWSSMPSGWNDVISSSHAGSGCNAIHYDNAGAGPNSPPSGASISCPTYSSCSSMGTMNDKTSSMRWVHT
jgi:hypothetical protein